MEEKDKKTVRKVIKWLWNLSLLYVLVFMVVVWQDAKANPELYGLVEERPPPEELSKLGEEWQKEASTIAECKPMVNFLDLYNRWIEPLVFFILIMAFVTFLVDNAERIKRFSDDAETADKEEKD